MATKKDSIYLFNNDEKSGDRLDVMDLMTLPVPIVEAVGEEWEESGEVYVLIVNPSEELLKDYNAIPLNIGKEEDKMWGDVVWVEFGGGEVFLRLDEVGGGKKEYLILKEEWGEKLSKWLK